MGVIVGNDGLEARSTEDVRSEQTQLGELRDLGIGIGIGIGMGSGNGIAHTASIGALVSTSTSTAPWPFRIAPS